MDKRFIWMMVGTMAFFTLFYSLMPAPKGNKALPPPAAATEATPGGTATAALTGGATPVTAPTAPKASGAAVAQFVEVETPLYLARFDTRGGRLVSLQLKNYKVEKAHTDWGDFIPAVKSYLGTHETRTEERVELVKAQLPDTAPFTVTFEGDATLTMDSLLAVYAANTPRLDVRNANTTLVLTGRLPNGLELRKTFSFQPDTYTLGYQLQVANFAKAPVGFRVENQMGEGPIHPGEVGSWTRFGGVYLKDGKVKNLSVGDMEEPQFIQQAEWLGYADNYFITAVLNHTPVSAGFYKARQLPVPGQDPVWIGYHGMTLNQVTLDPGNQVSTQYSLFMGPKDTRAMERFGHQLESSLDLTFAWVSMPMLYLLRWLQGFVVNWGVAIILLTLVVRLLLFPVTYKGSINMKKLQKLTPKMNAIRERHENDKERQTREMMELYKKHKVNPLSGCLPMVAQIPIFIALYSTLNGAIELRHESFIFWINDLSTKDGLYVLPVLMGASMFVQQKMTPSTMDSMQAKIFMWLPMVMTVFMVNFPSGLVLYWLVSNLLGIAQQAIINRVHIADVD